MEFVEIQKKEYFGAACFSQRYPQFKGVMDARNNEHENLELGAFFVRLIFLPTFQRKGGYFSFIVF